MLFVVEINCCCNKLEHLDSVVGLQSIKYYIFSNANCCLGVVICVVSACYKIFLRLTHHSSRLSQ